MRIQMISDERTYQGTPLQIVEEMSRRAIFRSFDSLDDYMKWVASQVSDSFHLEGRTKSDRAQSFLIFLFEKGRMRLEIQKGDVDGSTILILRRRHGWSQEEMAQRIGVSYTTINRWEKGKAYPRSQTHLRTLQQLADEKDFGRPSSRRSMAFARSSDEGHPLLILPGTGSPYPGFSRESHQAGWVDVPLTEPYDGSPHRMTREA